MTTLRARTALKAHGRWERSFTWCWHATHGGAAVEEAPGSGQWVRPPRHARDHVQHLVRRDRRAGVPRDLAPLRHRRWLVQRDAALPLQHADQRVDDRLERERCQVGPKDATWPVRSCGNTAMQG
jgi:hypothetical protein